MLLMICVKRLSSKLTPSDPLMNKQKLAEAIETYASAKSTGNPTLIQFAGRLLQEMLGMLPDGDLTKLVEPTVLESSPA